MRKKGLAAVAALVLGAVVFFVTVFSSPASAKGYEVYKTVEKTKEARATADVDVLITDNGRADDGRGQTERVAGSGKPFRDELGTVQPFSVCTLADGK